MSEWLWRAERTAQSVVGWTILAILVLAVIAAFILAVDEIVRGIIG